MRLKIMACVLLSAAALMAQPNVRRFRATLTGYQQIPTTVTNGKGTFELELNSAGTEATYDLKFSTLEGNATAARIHIGVPGTNGLFIVTLCGAPKAACPANNGEIKGTLKAADIGDGTIQGILPGEFADFVKALRAGALYVSVNSAKYPTGEVRGQIAWNLGRGIGIGRDDDDDDDDDDHGHGNGKK